MGKSKRTGSMLIGIILCSAMSVGAQSVEGVVQDENQSALSSASVVILTEVDSILAGFGVTNEQGKFRIMDVEEGEYILRINYLGFQELYRQLIIEPGKRLVSLGVITLEPADLTLEEVTIKAYQVPINIKRDTIEYNTSAFKTAPNAAVEDLLKKLPGIEVEKDGKIKAQGEEVNQVLVEGKEFFGNDPKIATKNLPADIVDKVQLFDKKSEMAEFSGIDDGQEQKTINLTLKEGKKGGFFGRANGGYGTQERYDGKFNLNRFAKKNQLSLIGMANNVNDQGFTFSDYMSFMGGLGRMMTGGNQLRINTGDVGLPIGLGSGQGFIDTRAGGLNYNLDTGKKSDVGISYFYNRVKNEIDRQTLREGLLEDLPYTTNESSESTTRQTGHTLNFNLRSRIDSTQWITVRSSASMNDGISQSNQIAQTKGFDKKIRNVTTTANRGSSDAWRGSLDGSYNRRLGRKSRILSASFNINSSEDDNFARLMTLYRFNPDLANMLLDSINQEQLQDGGQMNYRMNFSYTEPLGKRMYLELNYTLQNFNNQFDKDFFDILFNPSEQRVLNNMLSNSFTRDYRYHRYGFNFKVNRPKFSITSGVQLQDSKLSGEVGNFDLLVQQSFIFILPSVRMNFDFTPFNNLRLAYTTSTREPSIEQLQPILDNSDPLNLYKGNPDLNPEYMHSIQANYHSFSSFSNIAFFASLVGNITKDKIINAQTIDASLVQTIKPVNIDREWFFSSYVGFYGPLRFTDMKVGINSSISYNQSQLILNNIENDVSRFSPQVDFNLQNRKKEKWDWITGFSFTHSMTRYSENSSLDQQYQQFTYYAEVTYEPGKEWFINTSFDYDVFSNEVFSSATNVPIWNTSVTKNFLKSNKGQIKLTVFDVLNRNQGIYQSNSLNFVEESRIATLTRYFMVSFGYSFSGFGSEEDGMIRISNRRHR